VPARSAAFHARYLTWRSFSRICSRLSTIQNCDIICFFKEGRIVEKGIFFTKYLHLDENLQLIEPVLKGSHQELLALHGGYYELVTMQTLSKQ
jgi:hypothetical protein